MTPDVVLTSQRLENWIRQRTGGRLHNLRIEMVGDRMIVHGISGSYYVRQLALAAAIDLLGDDQADRVALDIQVDTGKRYDIKVDPFESSAPTRRQDSH